MARPAATHEPAIHEWPNWVKAATSRTMRGHLVSHWPGDQNPSGGASQPAPGARRPVNWGMPMPQLLTPFDASHPAWLTPGTHDCDERCNQRQPPTLTTLLETSLPMSSRRQRRRRRQKVAQNRQTGKPWARDPRPPSAHFWHRCAGSLSRSSKVCGLGLSPKPHVLLMLSSLRRRLAGRRDPGGMP